MFNCINRVYKRTIKNTFARIIKLVNEFNTLYRFEKSDAMCVEIVWIGNKIIKSTQYNACWLLFFSFIYGYVVVFFKKNEYAIHWKLSNVCYIFRFNLIILVKTDVKRYRAFVCWVVKTPADVFVHSKCSCIMCETFNFVAWNT